MAAITAAEFQAAIKKYMGDENLSIAALARKIGKGESTIGDWIRTGISRDNVRQKIVDQYPCLFNPELSAPKTVPARASEPGTTHNLYALVKIEQAHGTILHLTAILSWFLFAASATERNQFRDTLGDDWKRLLELTRAMTNETALEIAREEGRL